MTKITSRDLRPEEEQGRIVFSTAGTNRLTIDNAGGVKWGTSALSVSGSASLFTAGAGTTAVSGSSWDGVGSGTKYTVGDIVAALKAANILGA